VLTYSEKCGADAALNTIVMAGAHDAGISHGKWYARTQALNIRQQAIAGVRLFDLRIAAATSGGMTGGIKNAELRTYHADGKAKSTETKTRFLTDTGQAVQLDRSKVRMGAFGETLSEVLEQAKAFVSYHDSEFLILKFDKCLNWPLIAEACVLHLGQRIYKDGGNLNIKSLRELAGKVIVLFTSDGIAATPNFGPADGILKIKNCNGGGGYDSNYDGLQYYGKGGTSLMGVTPIKENRKKQRGLMQDGIKSNPQVMGMMYWTSTGLLGSIKLRDKMMWKQTNRLSLQQTWRAGLSESITDRLSKPPRPGSGGSVMKTFMPNIVMIDFARVDRCRVIMDLNDVAGYEMMKLYVEDIDADAAESS